MRKNLASKIRRVRCMFMACIAGIGIDRSGKHLGNHERPRKIKRQLHSLAVQCAPYRGLPTTIPGPIQRSNLSEVRTQFLTYSPIVNPLIFDTSSKPGCSVLAGTEFAGVRGTADRFSDHGALIRQGRKFDVVCRPTEEDERPAFVVRLLLWRCPGAQSVAALTHVNCNTYTTRWRLERRMPPLKTDIASPRLQIA